MNLCATTLSPLVPDLSAPLPRAGIALLLGAVVVSWLGHWTIPWLAAFCREPNHSDSATLARLHAAKDKTPTMGGLFLLAGTGSVVLLLVDICQPLILIGATLTAGLAALGAVDDLTKIRSRAKGLSPRAKLLGQTLLAAAAVAMLIHAPTDSRPPLALAFPGGSIHLGHWFLPLGVLVIVGTSNAVNLTDGLDGLASGCLAGCFAFFTILGFTRGCPIDGDLTNQSTGDLTVALAATTGGLLAFLWFNRHPARVFLGDTGSLALGGLLGYAALATGHSLLLPVVGGVFVAEALSVIAQVGSYKLRRKRVFLCAPLHHHFQFLGWPETKVVARFWLASLACAAVAGGILFAEAAREGSLRGEGPRHALARQAALESGHASHPLEMPVCIARHDLP